MGCCGGGDRSVRKMRVNRSSSKKKKKIVQQRVINNDSVRKQSIPIDRSVSLKRQALVRDDRCNKCDGGIMLVNIAGRERKQCVNCGHILK